MASRLLIGLVVGIGIAGCGDGDSPSRSRGAAGAPDYATVKRLALATPPINTCNGTKEAEQATPPGAEDQAQLAAGSMALSCAHVAAPLVRYLIFKTEADRDKEIRDLMLESGDSPFFVNGRTLVHVDAADPTKPSPLARRIKDKCGCGVVHEAGAR